MLAVKDKYPELFLQEPEERQWTPELNLESTLEELTLYDFAIEASEPGEALARAFAQNPLMPGAILVEGEKFVGMISRRRFLEHLSRPYGLELFSKRPLRTLHNFTKTQHLIIPSNTLIVLAARRSLQRSPQLLYEPIVVELEPDVYRLLDVHQLLVAQSKIHELTTKMLQEQTRSHMIQTEKMASLGRMVAGVAHEIKNPVNCISGNMGFLTNYVQDVLDLLSVYEEEMTEKSDRLRELESDIDLEFLREDFPKIVQAIEVSAHRLTKIVGGMQNFSHMDETARKPADLHECIDSTLLILHNRIKYDIELNKNYGKLPPVECYSGQLSQVFMNLLSNAVDALMERLEAEKANPKADADWKPRIEIATELLQISDNSDWAVIRIRDNGPGIPKDIQKRIFETFFTTKPVGKGTGLGLAISNEIIKDKHKGKLNLNSQVGIGTEFEIMLPVAKNEE
ncbi:sensor histidine kinase [Phormidium sp. CCY1219]|uniref:sensor histidine kinase n=1 Tax=Phormidium sp. CCY1219 TaxID=2886104 RepID=UPI002D1E6703|nr:ATP-binding protein [Phormidium sp. CCY1219]MEB3830666.1 ATP-binding protein [Phormidium sp. CCY1219]